MDKIYIQDQKGNGIVLLQYNFVQNNLRNFIRTQSSLNLRLNYQDLYNICKDVFKNLCHYHLQSIAILDILPETIVLEDGKWFILNLDNSIVSKTIQFGSTVSRPINSTKPLNLNYLAPLVYESVMNLDNGVIHNPYKSDVYSLGLVVWQLLNIGILQPPQIQQILSNRKSFLALNMKNTSFNLRQKILISNNKWYVLPNILTLMLQQQQQLRSYMIQICFSLNFTDTLFEKILVPYERFFKKQIFQIPNSNRKKIQYPYAGIQYQGDIVQIYQDIVKQGRGLINSNNTKIYDGQWRNNLPNGKCTMSFSSMWNYQGQVQQGMLHGQGVLTFNGIRIGSTRWMKNLDQQIISNNKTKLQKGYYFFVNQEQKVNNIAKNNRNSLVQHNNKKAFSNLTNISAAVQKQKNTSKQLSNIKKQCSLNYKVYYQKLHNQRTSYILNLMLVNKNEFQSLIELLLNKKYFLNQNQKIYSIKLYENNTYQRYNGKIFDLIRIGIKNKNENDTYDIYQNVTQQQQQYQILNLKQSNNMFPYIQQISINKSLMFIQLIVPNKLGTFVLQKISLIIHRLYSKPQFENLNQKSNKKNENNLFFDISQSSITEDQFRDLLNIGLPIKGLNISKCQNLSQNSIKYISLNNSCQNNLEILNISSMKIGDKSLQQLQIGCILRKLKFLNISFCPKFTSQKLAQFLCDQKLIKLQILQIAGLALNHRALQKIVKDCKLYNIRKLNIGSSHQLSQHTLLQFLKSKQLSYLNSLQCFSTTVKDNFLQQLSKDRQTILQLNDLNLSSSINLTVYGISKFFLSENSNSITKLNLSNLDILDQFLQMISIKNLLNQNLKQLNLSSCYKITDKSIKQLFKPDKFNDLKKLNLSRTNISNDTLFYLSQAYDRKLQYLKVYKCSKMNDTGFEHIINSPVFKQLKILDIGGTSIKSLSFIQMAGEKSYINLQQLFLNQCIEIDQKSLCFFLLSKKAISLRYLNISSTKLTGKVLESINKNPHLSYQLLQIKMNNCPHIKREQMINICIPNSFECQIKIKKDFHLKNNSKQLAKNPLLLKMTEFQINSQLDDIQCLFESCYIYNLTKLHVKWHNSSLILKSISNNLNFNNFKDLELIGCKFQQKQMINFIKSSAIKNIENLNLSWTQITNQTLFALSTSQFLTSLRSLNLSKCTLLNDKGLIKFINSTKVSSLQCLDLRSTLITNAFIQALGKSKAIKYLSKLILRSCNNINQLGFKDYLNSGNCSTLKQLDISWTRIGGVIFSIMNKSKNLQLNTLKISGLKGIQHQFIKFIHSQSCTTITQFQLNYTQYSFNLLINLSNTKYLNSIQSIQLLGYQIDNQEKLKYFKKLFQSSNMTKLKKIKINNTQNENLQYIIQILLKNILSIEKLIILGCPNHLIEKYKKILKKCQIRNQEQS